MSLSGVYGSIAWTKSEIVAVSVVLHDLSTWAAHLGYKHLR